MTNKTALDRVYDKIAHAKDITRYYNAIDALATEYCSLEDAGYVGTMELIALLLKHERAVNNANLKACNIANYDAEPARSRAYKAIRAALPRMPKKALFINGDPRGYALKIDDSFIRENLNADGMAFIGLLETDMGGYGLLCPSCMMESK